MQKIDKKLIKKKINIPQKIFPIKSETACQLKWNWSTIYLTNGTTSSCHRSDQHSIEDNFNFHNTVNKINDRTRMLQGQWPSKGCDHCRDIEEVGGQSDRITNLDFPGIIPPKELDSDLTAVSVTPRMLEVYFDNVCDLKCIYCGPHFSSQWDSENIRFGDAGFIKDTNMEKNKKKIFQWLKENGKDLTVFNFLGGEPFYQKELEECLDVFESAPMPKLKLQIFSNLNTKKSYLIKIIDRIESLIDRDHLKELEITASLDCWGGPQEYIRYPLNLTKWEENFTYLLEKEWINLIINSTITSLSIKTMPDLLQKIAIWNEKRTVYHYQNLTDDISYFNPYIFGDYFSDDFKKCLDLKPTNTSEEKSSRGYLDGIARFSTVQQPDVKLMHELFLFLEKNDLRRGTNWRKTFPWLVEQFIKHKICQD